MKNIKHLLAVLFLSSLGFGFLPGCESTEPAGKATSGVYYGAVLFDPWYYGDFYHGADVIVTPPTRPAAPPPEVSHPIATPPPVAARPLPSIPSAPRVSGRR